MLNWRRTALLASLSLTGRFAPAWEAGEGGEGWCWTLAIAGEEHCSQEASALPRGQGQQHLHRPLAPASAIPAAPQRMLLHEQCSSTGSCINHRGSTEAIWNSGMHYSSLRLHPITLLSCFFNKPIHSAAHSLPSLAALILLPNCSL